MGLVGHGICIHLFAGNTAVLKQDLMRVLSGKACAACQRAAINMYTEKKEIESDSSMMTLSASSSCAWTLL